MSGADLDYKYGRKINWRSTVWNRIKERCEKPLHDKKILYLAGEDDLDKPIAIAKGFKSENMIAVEKNKNVTKSLRDSGVLTIKGNILEVLREWNPERNLGVVHLDFCQGLEQETMWALQALITYPHLRKSVFSINFLRGRDRSSAEYRSVVSRVCGAEKIVLGETYNNKNRAHLMVWGIALRFFKDAIDNGMSQLTSDPMIIGKFSSGIHKIMKPSFLSYRSTAGNQVMDSTVFINPFSVADEESERIMDVGLHEWRKAHSDIKLRRQIAAVVAHQSRMTS